MARFCLLVWPDLSPPSVTTPLLSYSNNSKTKMKFSVLAFLTLAASVAAAPAPDADGHKMMKQFPIPNSMTVKQGQAKCGDGAQLSCCNKASYSGDTTHVGGTLSNLIGSGSASEGLGLFNQCSKLDAQGEILLEIVAYIFWS